MGVSEVNVCRGMAAAVLAVLLMLAVVVGARPAKLETSSCSTEDEYVYPYWSFCTNPAKLSTGYHYVSVAGLGGLEPEYDETNSTYYVRFTGSTTDYGATYVAVAASEDNSILSINSTVYIYNVKSERVLQWRQEGTSDYFLIEQEVSSTTEGAPFRFLQAEGTLLPCPLVYPIPQCYAYYLVSDLASSTYTDAGLLAYMEEGSTYIKAAASGSTGDLPILVVSSSSSSTTYAMPLPTIRTLTQ